MDSATSATRKLNVESSVCLICRKPATTIDLGMGIGEQGNQVLKSLGLRNSQAEVLSGLNLNIRFCALHSTSLNLISLLQPQLEQLQTQLREEFVQNLKENPEVSEGTETVIGHDQIIRRMARATLVDCKKEDASGAANDKEKGADEDGMSANKCKEKESSTKSKLEWCVFVPAGEKKQQPTVFDVDLENPSVSANENLPATAVEKSSPSLVTAISPTTEVTIEMEIVSPSPEPKAERENVASEKTGQVTRRSSTRMRKPNQWLMESGETPKVKRNGTQKSSKLSSTSVEFVAMPKLKRKQTPKASKRKHSKSKCVAMPKLKPMCFQIFEAKSDQVGLKTHAAKKTRVKENINDEIHTCVHCQKAQAKKKRGTRVAKKILCINGCGVYGYCREGIAFHESTCGFGGRIKRF